VEDGNVTVEGVLVNEGDPTIEMAMECEEDSVRPSSPDLHHREQSKPDNGKPTVASRQKQAVVPRLPPGDSDDKVGVPSQKNLTKDISRSDQASDKSETLSDRESKPSCSRTMPQGKSHITCHKEDLLDLDSEGVSAARPGTTGSRPFSVLSENSTSTGADWFLDEIQKSANNPPAKKAKVQRSKFTCRWARRDITEYRAGYPVCEPI